MWISGSPPSRLQKTGRENIHDLMSKFQKFHSEDDDEALWLKKKSKGLGNTCWKGRSKDSETFMKCQFRLESGMKDSQKSRCSEDLHQYSPFFPVEKNVNNFEASKTHATRMPRMRKLKAPSWSASLVCTNVRR